jgi:phosphoadenosine phosphosulfate reductase
VNGVPPDPGLDPGALAGLRRPHPGTASLPARIRAHLDAHDGYVAFSGGKDSLVVLHLTLAVEPDVPVVFFDSGLEFPETYRYLEVLRERLGLQLHGIRARHTTLDVLAASGAWDHTAASHPTPDLHEVLITEPAARAHRDHGPGELWGLRAAVVPGA